MERQINLGLVAMAAFLIIGSVVFPEGASMWLASTSLAMNIFRLLIIVVAVALLFTEPPRSKLLRATLFIASAGLVWWGFGRALAGTDQIIDALVAVAASISFAIAALEITEPTPRPKSVIVPEPAPSVFTGNLLTISDIRSRMATRHMFRSKVRETILFLAIVISASYKGLRPYRSIWRGG